MPRTGRVSAGSVCYHVLNRGNDRNRVFHENRDYDGFVELLTRAARRLPMRTLAYCLMPNHFHLVVWPHAEGDLGRWMHWLLTCHVVRHRRVYGGCGHVWQGRFKAFPVQQDHHLLTVIRYVERNPLRAGIVRRAEDWPWSSLGARLGGWLPSFLEHPPIELPPDWREWVNEPQTQTELLGLRERICRGGPYGDRTWTRTTAARLHLESSLRPVGRPRKRCLEAERTRPQNRVEEN